MRRSVDFHDEFCLSAKKISNIRTDGCLADEFEAGKPPIFETLPEDALRIRRTAAQIVRSVRFYEAETAQFCFHAMRQINRPLTLPLPASGERSGQHCWATMSQGVTRLAAQERFSPICSSAPRLSRHRWSLAATDRRLRVRRAFRCRKCPRHAGRLVRRRSQASVQ
jgi:hypothetical protein